jgi:hypothetical protein
MDKEVDRESSAITYFANEKKKKKKVLCIPNNLNMKNIWAQSRHKY